MLVSRKENIDIASNIVNADESFYGLHSPGLSLQGFIAHNKLLDGYAKLHKFKENNWINAQG